MINLVENKRKNTVRKTDHHISVCICTYKRPQMLANLLNKLQKQRTEELFTYSILVVDNDRAQSAKEIVLKFGNNRVIDVDYFCEPIQNIALARNKAIQNAKGDFLALIDDDELPTETWLLILYDSLNTYNADGVLAPVNPIFEKKPPKWVVKGKFHQKPFHETGFALDWKDTRTSNVLIKRTLFDLKGNKFDPRFGRGGEDKHFFKKMIEKGYLFIWCNEAPVNEVIPPQRCQRLFLLKRALLRGKSHLLYPEFGVVSVIKSLVAIPLYSLTLPVLFLLGHHIFMDYIIRTFEHIGKILYLLNLDIIKQKYVME